MASGTERRVAAAAVSCRCRKAGVHLLVLAALFMSGHP